MKLLPVQHLRLQEAFAYGDKVMQTAGRANCSASTVRRHFKRLEALGLRYGQTEFIDVVAAVEDASAA